MSYLNSNIRYLRKQQGMTQQVLAEKIGVKRSLIGAYEENRAEPKIATIQKLAYVFDANLDALINLDLSKDPDGISVDMEGKTLRVLPIVVDREDRERIAIVPVHARAGYSHGYADPEYIGELPSFNLPLQELYADKSYRLFQIDGDSMLPIPSGSYVICEYADDWQNVKDGTCYVVVTKDQGIVYKRVWYESEREVFVLKSDNTTYEPYEIPAHELLEMWKSLGYMSFNLPDEQADSTGDIRQLNHIITKLKNDVAWIKDHIPPQGIID